VATFAHELAHYRLATISDALPGGREMHEYAADLMTVFLGFGLAVFLALRDEPENMLKAGLKSHLYSDLKAASRYLARNPALLDEQRALTEAESAQEIPA
jgi:hypothetical protein